MQLRTDFTYDQNSVNILDKNITSFNATIKSQNNFLEENIRISHRFIDNENLVYTNFNEQRYSKAKYDSDWHSDDNYLTKEEEKKKYHNEEDEIYCGRFPHLNYCGCNYPCSITLNLISPIEIIPNIYCGSIETAYKTKELLSLKVNYILNLSCTEYRKRIKYFKYLDIFINDSHTENAIKFFKITNRFIDQGLKNNNKILIHSVNGKSRCWVFIIAYLIGRLGYKFHEAKEVVLAKFKFLEINHNFENQLKHYDLESNK